MKNRFFLRGIRSGYGSCINGLDYPYYYTEFRAENDLGYQVYFKSSFFFPTMWHLYLCNTILSSYSCSSKSSLRDQDPLNDVLSISLDYYFQDCSETNFRIRYKDYPYYLDMSIEEAKYAGVPYFIPDTFQKLDFSGLQRNRIKK